MTTVATFTVAEDAHLFRSFLESRGIESHVLDENVVQWFWHYSNALGGVRVVVDEEDVEKARAAYQEYMAALRDGPFPVGPVRAWPVVIVLSVAMAIPLLIFGRNVSQRRREPL
jgi:hypothetical protein